MRWILPSSSTFNKTKSNEYLTHVLGNAGKNSLLSILIKENLATKASAGIILKMNQSMDRISYSITLTGRGEQEYLRVIELVYKFIN